MSYSFVENKTVVISSLLIFLTTIAFFVIFSSPNKARGAEFLLRQSNTSFPYVLNKPDTVYKLETDLTAEGTAFVVGAHNVTLDLNGKTLIFGNTPSNGIANFSFEEGNGTVPYNWDLTQANSAKRTATTQIPMIGNWLLMLDKPTQTQQVVSSWQAIAKANRTYVGAAIMKGCWGCNLKLQIEREGSGVVGEMVNYNNEQGAGMLNVKFKPDSPGNYRIRMIFDKIYTMDSATGAIVSERPVDGSKTIYIDYADLRPAFDAGIVENSFYSNLDYPDLAGVTGWGQYDNFSVKNGNINEGSGKGFKYMAVSKSGPRRFEMANINSYVSGINSMNFRGSYSSNNFIHDSVLKNDAQYGFNRGDFDNCPVYVGPGPNQDFTFYNNTIDGGQGGICLMAMTNVDIYNNTIKNRPNLSNHYGVIAYGNNPSYNIKIHDNRFLEGQGVFFSSKTKNSSIYNNYFNLKAVPPNTEYPSGYYSTSLIRISDYGNIASATENIKVFNNTMYGEVSAFPQYPNCKPTLQGINVGTAATNNEYYNNRINVRVLDNKSEAFGITGYVNGNMGLFKNNYVESNYVNMRIGTDSGDGAFNGNFVSNTLVKGENPINYHTFFIGYGYLKSEGHKFLDTRFLNGASMTDVAFDGLPGSTHNYTVQWFLNLFVTDGTQPISNAAVTIKDKSGVDVFSGTTNSDGRVEKVVLDQFYRSNVYPSTIPTYDNRTPHIITISANGKTETKTVTMDSSKDLTVVLDGLDSDPPIISDIKYQIIDQDSVKIFWQTNNNSDSSVKYGLDTNYGSIQNDSNLTTSHQITLDNLVPSLYNYQAVSKSSSGLESKSFNQNFFLLSEGNSADISLNKAADKNSASSGEVITYTITYLVGSSQITNAVIADNIPNGTTYVSSTNNGVNNSGTVTWNLGTLASGATGTVQLVVKAN